MATLAPALRNLIREIDARWPRRSHRVDGWYRRWVRGARPSDHHPDRRGMVHAVDITSATILPYTVLALTARMAVPVNYVIFNRRIYSRHRRFSGVPYYGPHPHTDHLHVSLLYGSRNENWSGNWGIANVPGGKDWVKRVTVPGEPWHYAHVIGTTADRYGTLNYELNRSSRQIYDIR